MIKNYFKTAWRSLMRFKVFTLINILGLAIGISAALVIYLIAHHEFTFDKFEPDNNRIYRVVTDYKFSGVPHHNQGVPAPVAEAVRKEFTGLSVISAFHQYDDDLKITIPREGQQPLTLKKQGNAIFADANYFKIVPYTWVSGSPAASLTDPFKLVITEKRLKALFPELNASQVIGRQVIYNDTVRLTVSGVVKTITQNTDFIFQDFISLSTIPNSGLKGNYSWGNWGMTNGSSQLYVKLAPGTQVAKVEAQLTRLLARNEKPHKHYEAKLALQPLSDLHFNSDYGTYGETEASKSILYSLLLVAVFLLLLGCINFINLSTAHAAQRAKEIGIRKTMGSSKTQLIFQFLSETLLITLLATILSLVFAPVLLKIFADFIPQGLHLDLLNQPNLMVFLVLLVIAVSLLSGFYPSWVLSGYNPVLVLKNQAYANTGKTRKTWVRKSLTVFQFLIAQVFIMGTFIVAKQIHYTLNKDLGFKKDAILYFSTPFYDKHPNNRFVVMNELKQIPEIELVSLGGSSPSSTSTSSSQMAYKDGKKEVTADVQFKYGDANYLKLYHIKLLAGNNVSGGDTIKSVIINETYAHMIGFTNPQDAVGKVLNANGGVRLPVIGVLADFYQQSLRHQIKPLMFTSAASNSFTIHVALKPQGPDGTDWKNAISKIEKAYKGVYPDQDFEYQFYDQSIAQFYKSDQDISRLLRWATGLAIFISCLGLLGLVIYTTNHRTKEIGIRKVLGASVTHIVAILSTDFVKLVLISFAIAAPIAWYGMSKWLDNYAYRTSMNWWVFALSGALMVLIALITLSFQTIRAAIANPVKSLKTE